jgi:hypothetical protein
MQKTESTEPMTFSILQQELKDILPTGTAYKALDEAIKSESNDLASQIDCYTKYHDKTIEKIGLIKLYDDNINTLINKSSFSEEQKEESSSTLKTILDIKKNQIHHIEKLILDIKTPSQNFLIDTIKSSHPKFDTMAEEMTLDIDFENQPSASIKRIGILLQQNPGGNLHDILENARLKRIRDLETEIKNNNDIAEAGKLSNLDTLFQNRTGRTFFRLFGKPNLQAVLNEIGIQDVNVQNNDIKQAIKLKLVQKFGNAHDAKAAFEASCANRYNMYSSLYKQIADLKLENGTLKSQNQQLRTDKSDLESEKKTMADDIRSLISNNKQPSKQMKQRYLSAKDRYEAAATAVSNITYEEIFKEFNNNDDDMQGILTEQLAKQAEVLLQEKLKERIKEQAANANVNKVGDSIQLSSIQLISPSQLSNRSQAPKAEGLTLYTKQRPASASPQRSNGESLVKKRRNSLSQGSVRSQ